MAWFQQAPRPGFSKATVSAWRVSLEERRLMSAIRKLAAEAADNGMLAPELAAGISRVKSAKTQGIRVGNWLSLRQAQALLSAPDITTLRELRDRAILAILLGCGLRRSEVSPKLPSAPALRPRTKSEPSGTNRIELPTSALAATPPQLYSWNPSLTHPSPVAAPPALTTSISACAKLPGPSAALLEVLIPFGCRGRRPAD
jgi:hypothetical protein